MEPTNLPGRLVEKTLLSGAPRGPIRRRRRRLRGATAHHANNAATMDFKGMLGVVTGGGTGALSPATLTRTPHHCE